MIRFEIKRPSANPGYHAAGHWKNRVVTLAPPGARQFRTMGAVYVSGRGSDAPPIARHVIDARPRPGGRRRWVADLERIRGLSEGWNGYSAPPPAEAAITAARYILESMDAVGLPATRIAPSVVGGVGVTRRVGGRKVYIEARNDGRVYALFSDGTDPVAVSVPMSAQALRGFLGKVRDHLNG